MSFSWVSRSCYPDGRVPYTLSDNRITQNYQYLAFSHMTKFLKKAFSSLPWVPEATRLLNETSVRSEVSEASEGPNASSLWWQTPTVSL